MRWEVGTRIQSALRMNGACWRRYWIGVIRPLNWLDVFLARTPDRLWRWNLGRICGDRANIWLAIRWQRHIRRSIAILRSHPLFSCPQRLHLLTLNFLHRLEFLITWTVDHLDLVCVV